MSSEAARGHMRGTSHRYRWAGRWPVLRLGPAMPEQGQLLGHEVRGAGTGIRAQDRRGLSGYAQTWFPCPLLPLPLTL